MKKVFGVSLLALMLVCLVCASALAQTTGIAMDGKVYTFTGGEGTYQADGKTFIIGADAVIVQEPGFPDRVLELHQTEGTEIMRDGHPAAAGQETDDSTVICEGTAAYEAAEAIAVYEQYSYSYPENDEAWARRFAPYAEYGLRCDPESRTLMYQGQRVRSFTDAYSMSGGVCTIIEFTAERQHEIGFQFVNRRLHRLKRAVPQNGHRHAVHNGPRIAARQDFAVQRAGNPFGIVGFALRDAGKPAVSAEQNGKRTHQAASLKITR